MLWALTQLFCCVAGCRPSVLASMLAFHPPKPCLYGVTADGHIRDETGRVLTNIEAICVPCVRRKGHEVLVAVIRPTRRALRQGPVTTVLFFHGNATDVGLSLARYRDLANQHGVNVVAVEYSGYGLQVGLTRPTEASVFADAETAYAYVTTKRPDLCPNGAAWRHLIVYGQSVGSGPASWLASRHPLAGLVLHSPLASGIRVMFPSRPLGLGCCDVFDNKARAPRFNAPVLIIHGSRDEEVPAAHGLAVWAALPERLRRGGGAGGGSGPSALWTPPAGHNDVLALFYDDYHAQVNAFLAGVEAARGGSSGSEGATGSARGGGSAQGGAASKALDGELPLPPGSPALTRLIRQASGTGLGGGGAGAGAMPASGGSSSGGGAGAEGGAGLRGEVTGLGKEGGSDDTRAAAQEDVADDASHVAPAPAPAFLPIVTDASSTSSAPGSARDGAAPADGGISASLLASLLAPPPTKGSMSAGK